jgi:hypothetical protein
VANVAAAMLRNRIYWAVLGGIPLPGTVGFVTREVLKKKDWMPDFYESLH